MTKEHIQQLLTDIEARIEDTLDLIDCLKSEIGTYRDRLEEQQKRKKELKDMLSGSL